MLDPEEQESQIVAPLHDTQLESSDHDVDNAVHDSNNRDMEQHLLRPLVEETQFVDIELDSQALESSPYRPIVRPEPSTTDDIPLGFKYALLAKPVAGRFSVGRQQNGVTAQHNLDTSAGLAPACQQINHINIETSQQRPDALLPTTGNKPIAQTMLPGKIHEDFGFNQKKINSPAMAWKSKAKQRSFSAAADTQMPKTRKHPFPEVKNAGHCDMNIETPPVRTDQIWNTSSYSQNPPAQTVLPLVVPPDFNQPIQTNSTDGHQGGLLESINTLTQDPLSGRIPKAVEATCTSGQTHEIDLHQDDQRVSRKLPSGDLSGSGYPGTGRTECVLLSSGLPSQTPSGTQSRPQSASNIGVAMTRPLNPRDLMPQGASDSPALHFYHAIKVMKPTNRHQAARPMISDLGGNPTNGGQERATMLARYPSFLEEAMRYKAIADDYYAKDAYIESLGKEIETLKSSEADLRKGSESLKAENIVLQLKARKCKELSFKYKEHMNKVVQCQDMLGNQAKEMRTLSSQAISAYNEREATYARHEAVAKRITDTLKDIKQKRLEADKSVTDEKSLVLIAQKNAKEAANRLEFVSTEKEQLSVELQACLKTNGLLQADLQKNLIELSREKHHSEQLHKQLSTQLEVHREHAELLKKVPVDIVRQLTEDEGVLANILTLENRTQSQLDELTTDIQNLKDHEPEPPLSLVMLIQDAFKNVSNELQSLEGGNAYGQERIFEQFEELKGRLHQLQVDAQAQSRLKDQISELRESNVALAADRSNREQEIQNLAQQLDKVRQNLNNCSDQLVAKSQDLEDHLALPKEDLRHVATIKELENVISSLHKKLDLSAQQASKTEEELELVQAELKEAKTQIEYSDSEKRKLQMAVAEESEHSKQAKAVNDEKLLKLGSTANNLRQTNKAKDAQLKTANEELNEIRAKNEALTNTAEKHESEKELLERELFKVIQSQERLEALHLDCGTQDRILELESIHNELRRVTNQVLETSEKANQDIDHLATANTKLGENITKSEDENALLHKRISELQAQTNRILKSPRNIGVSHADGHADQVDFIQPQSQRKMLKAMPPPMARRQNVIVDPALPPVDSCFFQSQAHIEDDAVIRPNRGYPTVNSASHSELEFHRGLSHVPPTPQRIVETYNLKNFSSQDELPETQFSQNAQNLPVVGTNSQSQQDLQLQSPIRRRSNRKSISSRSIYQATEDTTTIWDMQPRSQQRDPRAWKTQGPGSQSNVIQASPMREREAVSSYRHTKAEWFNPSATQEKVQSSPHDRILPFASITSPSVAGSAVSAMSSLSDLENRMRNLDRGDEHTLEDVCSMENCNTPLGPDGQTETANGNLENPRTSIAVQKTDPPYETGIMPPSQPLDAPGITSETEEKQGKRSEPNHRQKSKLRSVLKATPASVTTNGLSENLIHGNPEVSKVQPLQSNHTLRNKTIGKIASNGQIISQGKYSDSRSYKQAVEGNRSKLNAPVSSYAYHPTLPPRRSPMAGVPARNKSNRAKRQPEPDASERPSKILRISLPNNGLGLH